MFKVKDNDERRSVRTTICTTRSIYERLESIANKKDISRCELINQCIEYALKELEEDEK